jgi:hypothetical protein
VRRAIALSLFFVFIPYSSPAATNVRMQSLKATTAITLSTDPNDQVSTLVTTPNSIVIAGTSAGDGFLTSFDRTGSNILWSLHFGGTSDDIATTAIKDTVGNYWVAGATAVIPNLPPAPVIPEGTLNPSGVQPESATAIPALTQLDLWKVSAKGVLIKSYSTMMSNVIFPEQITFKNGIVTISGAIASQPSDHFSISLETTGTFGSPRISSAKSLVSTGSKEIKTTLSLWKSYTTSSAIKGLPSWKPKPNSHVLIRSDLKTKAVIAAYLTSSEIIDFSWEKSLGIAVLLSNSNGYSLAIIK